jgi:TonB family protein
VFDFKQEEDDDGQSPTQSILGLGRIDPSPFRMPAGVSRDVGEPPGRSLLGLIGIEPSPFRPTASPPGQPPTASLLGLRGIRPAPIVRRLSAGPDEPPPNPSILGLGGIRPSALPPIARAPRRDGRASPSFFGLGGPAATPFTPRPGGQPGSRSFFGLQGLPYAVPSRPRPIHREPAEIDVPEFERDVEHRAEPAFPVERAILLSLAAHVLLLLLILVVPSPTHDPGKGLLAAFVAPEKSDEEKFPIVFREAPGPERANPRKSDLSDADRRAGGGDRSKPRSESPFVAQRPGKEALAPGPRRPPAPPAQPPPGSATRQAEAGKGPAASIAGEGKAVEEPAPSSETALAVPRSPNGSGQTPGGRSAATLQGLNQAIRDAARGVGARGEDGAGFPNPGGGFVDSGPLSFDTTWYDWGPYAAEMIRRIKLHWDVPELARFGWKGRVTVRFFILADGRVEGATIVSRSGVPPFDYAALQAIVTSSPFRPLPKDLGEEREGITVTFFYNLRPGEAGSEAAK